MSITSTAGESFLILRNEGRTSPIVFPGFDVTHDFTWSVWVYPLGVRGGPGIDVSIHMGTDGSRIFIGHNGYTWAYSSRYAAVGEATTYFDDVVYNRWACISFHKQGNNVTICYGLQDTDDLNPSEYPVVMNVVIATTTDVLFDFDQFYLTVGHNQYMSNFKFWNYTLTLSQVQAEANRFDTGTAFWASTLRTPGDISNIANPRTGPDWAARHGYSGISDLANLVIGSDPAYMAKYTPCPTWIYPINPNAASNFNPGTSPLVSTTYDSLQFWEFDDRGSIDSNDATVQSVEYFGWPHAAATGYVASDSWPLFLNELGAKITVGHTAANRFETDTGVVVPGAKASTLYLWKYGAQFTWPLYTPQGPTANQAIDFLYLYVVYIGIPTGIPALPVADLTGLFAINKGSHVDQYNRGVQLKIPAPTIRTAYIGE